MTVTATAETGATSATINWSTINWTHVERSVKRLQVRIAKATKAGRWGKVKALQWLLTHSINAKLLAVKRVTGNRGANTPGIDGVKWQTSSQKTEAAQSLKRQGYQPQPLKRIYIPKKNGQRRPLGIPTMIDRAHQALHWLGLEPVSETIADRNAYGFRQKRGTVDAISQCFNLLSRKSSAQWILEGDIKGCFDNIDHQWLSHNIPMDKDVLIKWLKAGYMDKNVFYPTELGTPQGGIISPTLMLMTLRGLENAVTSQFSKADKVHVVIYADDFIITGTNRQVLCDKVMPIVESFLAKRGLQLSREKTLVTSIDKGFDFLGFTVRKYRGKLLIKPAKKNVNAFLADIRSSIKSKKTVPSGSLIRLLNPKIQGWANYYRHVVSKKTFCYVDHAIFKAIWHWCKRRHPCKSAHWVKHRYFRSEGLRHWIFHGKTIDGRGEIVSRKLVFASSTAIRRHTKVRSDANPYDALDSPYFEKRSTRKCFNYLTKVENIVAAAASS